MGKVLIIKGADFSANAVDKMASESTLIQAVCVSISTSGSYGQIINPNSSIKDTSILTKILIPSQKRAIVDIYDNNIKVTDLTASYNATPESIELVLNGRLNTASIIESTGRPDDTYRQPDGSFVFENTTGQDLYYYINFAIDFGTTVIPLVGKTCFYKIFNLL